MDLPVKYDKLKPHERRAVREQYVVVQKGACSFCGTPLDSKPANHVTDKIVNVKLFPRGFFTHTIHLHHDHNTGLTIGAVHNYCNAVLWQYYGE